MFLAVRLSVCPQTWLKWLLQIDLLIATISLNLGGRGADNGKKLAETRRLPMARNGGRVAKTRPKSGER